MNRYTMIRSAKIAVLEMLGAGFLILTHPAAATTAPTVSELKNVQIEGHYFTTAITSRTRRASAKDASNARYVVLVLSGTLDKGEGKIFGTDFTLRNFENDGSESRSKCSAIARSKTPTPRGIFDLNPFLVGQLSWIKVHSGQNRIALASMVGSDVETIDLYLLGVSEPLTYRIGTDRPYSVFITTNLDKKTLLEAKKVVEKGGYQVTDVSEGLAKKETGITIHYSAQAENQAREISQRLMIAFGKAPSLQKMKLVTDVDIVIWLGK